MSLDVMEVRRAGAADAELLAALGAETFSQTFGHLYSDADLKVFLRQSHGIDAYTDLLGRSDCAAWIGEVNGEAVGYSTASPCHLPVPDMPANAGELQRLYLLSKGRGAGRGTRLLETTLQWLSAHFEHIFVSVYAENYGAQRLYARYGFEKIHDYHFMVGNHADPEWIMERKNLLSPDLKKGR